MPRFQIGDMVIVDYPGTVLHDCYGIVVRPLTYESFSNQQRFSYPIDSDTSYEVVLSNPPEDHPKQIMLRGKWMKLLSKISEKNT